MNGKADESLERTGIAEERRFQVATDCFGKFRNSDCPAVIWS